MKYMPSFEDIQKANATIKTTPIHGKNYAEVPQRVKAFRMIYPTGLIETQMVSLENGVCIMKATVGFYEEDGSVVVLGTGTAYEREGASNINKTSFIENCETSAVGRALGMAGFGIDVSVASAEEVQNAILQQTELAQKIDVNKADALKSLIEATGTDEKKFKKAYLVKELADLTMEQWQDAMRILTERTEKQNANATSDGNIPVGEEEGI